MVIDARRDVLRTDGVKIVVNHVAVRIIQLVILCLDTAIVNLVIKDNIANLNV
jgi:hypothetical protein